MSGVRFRESAVLRVFYPPAEEVQRAVKQKRIAVRSKTCGGCGGVFAEQGSVRVHQARMVCEDCQAREMDEL